MAIMDVAFDPKYGEAWNRRQVSEALTLPNTHAILINHDGVILDQGEQPAAGFVLSRAAPGEEELLLIAVLPELRQRGLGEILIDRLIFDARKRGSERIFLEMREGNPAVNLYQKLGFTPIGKRTQYIWTLYD
ncbi:MAG: GNAT family N-acetyltransferase [Pseudomonadota bacterium]